MDRNKIREFVRQAHPNRRILTDETADASPMASSDDRDVDVGNLQLSKWDKLRPASSPPTERDPMSDSRTTGAPETDARAKYRPRRLTGGKSAGTRALPQDAGKIALERLEFTPAGGSADTSENSLDVLVDEEHGIIGESDSGPEKPR